MRLFQKELLLYKPNWDEWIVKQLNTEYGFTGCLAGDEGFLLTGNFSEYFITKDCINFYKYSNPNGITTGGTIRFANIINQNHGYPTALLADGSALFADGSNKTGLYQIKYNFNDFDSFKNRADGVGLAFAKSVDIQTSNNYTTRDIDFDGANYRVIGDNSNGLYYAEIPYDSVTTKSNWATTSVTSGGIVWNGNIEIGSNALAVPNVISCGIDIVSQTRKGFYFIGRYNASYKPEFELSKKINIYPNRAKYINSTIGTIILGESGIIAQIKSGQQATIYNVGNYNWQDLAYGSNRIVIVSQDGYITETTDGVNYTTPIYTGIDGSVYSIGYANGKFLIVGTTGQIAYKTV